MAKPACPDIRKLQDLLAEKLDSNTASDLSAHIEGCSDCQKTLEGLSPMSRSWADVLGALSNEEPLPEAGLERVLKNAGVAEPEATQDVAAQESSESAHSKEEDRKNMTEADFSKGDGVDALDLLQPSTKPGSLGQLGHYEVLEVLGQGGFGVVVRAFDEKLQRVVAIKLMSPQLAATSPARKRFLREARASAKVRHENVVQIYAVEEKPIPHLVMEYIPGRSLQQKLDETGPLETPEMLRLAVQIARGLAAAHAQGLIHRDIKPGNILLEESLEPHAKITDFGLARAADDASLTQSGVVAGTPMYMAPEQAEGKTIDQRADLFSLGSAYYVMLSGRPPFRASGTMAVLKRVCEDIPRPIREIIPEVPEWLCDIISKLHAKKPEDRFQTAKEVADLLAQRLADLQAGRVIERAASVSERSAAPASVPLPTVANAPSSSRTMLAMLLCGVGALSLMMGVGLSIWLAVVSGQILQSRFAEFAVFAGSLLVHGLSYTATAYLVHRQRGRVFGFIALLSVGCIAPIILILNVFTETNHWPVLMPFVLGLPVALWTIGILLRDGVLGQPIGGTAQPARAGRSQGRRWAVAAAVGVIALLVAGLFASPFLYRYLTDHGILTYSGTIDPNIDSILIKRDGQVVADLITRHGTVQLPTGDYEAEVVVKDGHELAKYRVGPFSHLAGAPGALGWQKPVGRTFPLTLPRDFHVGISLEVARLSDPEPGRVQLRFANDDQVEIPTLILETDQALTMEATVTVQDLRPSGRKHLCLLGVNWQLNLGINARHEWTFAGVDPRGGGLGTFYTPGAPVQIGKPVHVACVYTAKELRLYLDGKLASRQIAPKTLKEAKTNFRIGGVDNLFTGAIAEVRVSKGARYADNFVPPKRFTPDADTLALYHCDEGKGDVLKDSSGHGHDGKILGAQWVHGSKTEPGWVQLFNGKDITGWKTNPRQPGDWEVKNGELVAKPNRQANNLFYVDKEFSDFHLRVKVKINEGSSGVYFRGKFDPLTVALIPDGYVAQINTHNFGDMSERHERAGANNLSLGMRVAADE